MGRISPSVRGAAPSAPASSSRSRRRRGLGPARRNGNDAPGSNVVRYVLGRERRRVALEAPDRSAGALDSAPGAGYNTLKCRIGAWRLRLVELPPGKSYAQIWEGIGMAAKGKENRILVT